jgi:hypothetical protein
MNMEGHLVKVRSTCNFVHFAVARCIRFRVHRHDVFNRRNCVLFMRFSSKSNVYVVQLDTILIYCLKLIEYINVLTSDLKSTQVINKILLEEYKQIVD